MLGAGCLAERRGSEQVHGVTPGAASGDTAFRGPKGCLYTCIEDCSKTGSVHLLFVRARFAKHCHPPFSSPLSPVPQERDADQRRAGAGMPRCHFFSTFFASQLGSRGRDYSYPAVQRWTAEPRLRGQHQVRFLSSRRK